MKSGALLVAPVLLALILTTGCGGSGSSSTAATSADVRAALEARLRGKDLSYHWVYCVRTKGQFAGRSVFHCNVDFGEPHIVPYCATLNDGHLVTNLEEPTMRCGRDVRT